jgi:AAA ATPase domain
MADYDLDELRASFRSVMRKGTRYEREEVIPSLAHYLGFVRLTDPIHQAIKSAITSAIRHGILRSFGNILTRIWGSLLMGQAKLQFPDMEDEPTPDVYPGAFLNRSDVSPYLASVDIDGLKGFDYVEIELRRLTILTGPNNSGKSTILQAIALAFECFRPLRGAHRQFVVDLSSFVRRGLCPPLGIAGRSRLL